MNEFLRAIVENDSALFHSLLIKDPCLANTTNDQGVSAKEMINSDPDSPNRFSPDGFQPLGLAAYFGHTIVARYLLDHGADPNSASRNAQRVTPLHSAASSDSLLIASSLIEKGADVNAKQQGGYTPLHAAVQNGSREMAKLLIENPAVSG